MSTSPAPRLAPRETDFSDAASAGLAHVLRDVCRSLVEPRAPDPSRAIVILDRFVETIAGFALGAVVHQALVGVRRWFGDAGVAAVHPALRRWSASSVAASAVPHPEAPRAHGLVAELGARLHVRCCRAAPAIRALVTIIRRALVDGAPHRATMIEAMFGLLAEDDAFAHRLADELAFGWAVFSAAATEAALPSLADRSPRSRALWEAWWWQLAGGRPATLRDAATDAGYIQLVR